MNKDIIYLKNEEHGTSLVAFDTNRLTKVEVYRQEEGGYKKFDNQDDYDYSLNMHLTEYDYKITSRQEFNDAFIAYSKNLNEITKEL